MNAGTARHQHTSLPRPLHPMTAPLRLLAATCALLLANAALAATPTVPAKPPARPAAKPATKPAPAPAVKPRPGVTRQQADSSAKGLALATATVETISAGQLDVAARVLTGMVDCEFNQRVQVQPVDGQPGYFTVSHQGRHYRMLPRETTTGAVRLEDPVNGIVWLQIPVKSMLMNARRGQRMIDSCLHADQRAALAAATAAAAAGTQAGQGIGIVPGAAPPAAAASDPQAAVAPPAAVPSDTPASR